MIEVGVRKGGIMISGHAGYAPAGYDIVCAGVTALTQGLVRSMEGLADDRIETDIESGMTSIQYGDLSEKGKLLIDSFFYWYLYDRGRISELCADYMTRRGSRKTLRDEKGQAWIPVKLRETVKQGTLKTMEAEYEEQRI